MQKNRAIASARAFLNNPQFGVIVEILKLFPNKDWSQWQDFEGNSLRILKNKTIRIYPSKIDLETTKDIYRKAHPRDIAKHSYWILAMLGNEESIFSFLGNDGILRTCCFKDNFWENIPSIMLGYKTLNYIAKSYIEADLREVYLSEVSYPKNFKIEEIWAGSYPIVKLEIQEKIKCHLMISQSLPEQLNKQEEMDFS